MGILLMTLVPTRVRRGEGSTLQPRNAMAGDAKTSGESINTRFLIGTTLCSTT